MFDTSDAGPGGPGGGARAGGCDVVDLVGVEELGSRELADAVVDLGVRQRWVGARRLMLAVAWADRHVPACQQGGERLSEGEPVCGCRESRTVPSWGSRVRVCRWPGHDGTPAVSVSGVAEFAVLCATTTASGSLLLGDALDLRHRHPRLWARVLAGQVEDWQARRVARMCGVLERDAARAVDAETAGLVGALAWGRVLERVEAAVVAADPEGHRERCREAEERRYVSAGRYRGTNGAGMRTLVAQTTAGDVARIDAMVQHLADLLAVTGVGGSNDVRRAQGLALLANPAQACLLLASVQHPDSIDPADPADPVDPADPAESAETDDTEPEPVSAVQAAAVFGQALAAHAERHGVQDLWRRLRPPVSLVFHLSEAAAAARVARAGDATGPLGPVGLAQLRDLLAEQLPGWLCDLLQSDGRDGRGGRGDRLRLRDQVVVRPVIDTTGQVPVDAYEVPATMREALTHATVYETFPWGTADARVCQVDHTDPYQRKREGRPPPGQTRPGNLGPLGAGHHNLKTHHRWRCHQPLPGLYLWQTPSGHWYRVDATGTTALGRSEPEILRQLREPEPVDAELPPPAPQSRGEISDEELDRIVRATGDFHLAA